MPDADVDGAIAAYEAAVAQRVGAGLVRLVAASDGASVAADVAATAPVRVVSVLGGCPVACADLRGEAARARVEGVFLVADATATTTHGCAACHLGAHLSFAEVDEGIFVIALARDADVAAPGASTRTALLSAPCAPRAAAVAASDGAVAARWHATSDAAAVLAAYLAAHPAVAAVAYPGLKADASFRVAARTLVGGFGAVLCYATVAAPDVWERVVATDADPRAQVMELERRLA